MAALLLRDVEMSECENRSECEEDIAVVKERKGMKCWRMRETDSQICLRSACGVPCSWIAPRG